MSGESKKEEKPSEGSKSHFSLQFTEIMTNKHDITKIYSTRGTLYVLYMYAIRIR